MRNFYKQINYRKQKVLSLFVLVIFATCCKPNINTKPLVLENCYLREPVIYRGQENPLEFLVENIPCAKIEITSKNKNIIIDGTDCRRTIFVPCGFNEDVELEFQFRDKIIFETFYFTSDINAEIDISGRSVGGGIPAPPKTFGDSIVLNSQTKSIINYDVSIYDANQKELYSVSKTTKYFTEEEQTIFLSLKPGSFYELQNIKLINKNDCEVEIKGIRGRIR